MTRVSTHHAIRICHPDPTAGPMLLARYEEWQRSLPKLRVIVLRAPASVRTLTPFSDRRSPGASMAIVHPHNLRNPDAGIQRPYGVRITLKTGDPFRKLLGA